MHPIRVGTAGWSIPRDVGSRFPGEGSALERYAARFPAVEINSSFHRPHRIATWERWRDSTPASFRFAVKLPKTITHERKLVDFAVPLDAFLQQVQALRDKLAVILVQLPPKLAFDAQAALALFSALAARTGAQIVCEPRHPSWFSPEADDLLALSVVSRAAADPATCMSAALPGGHDGLCYWRLHGSPVMYRSSYADRLPDYVHALAADAARAETWCMFDNTASSAATADALALIGALHPSQLPEGQRFDALPRDCPPQRAHTQDQP